MREQRTTINCLILAKIKIKEIKYGVFCLFVTFPGKIKLGRK